MPTPELLDKTALVAALTREESTFGPNGKAFCESLRDRIQRGVFDITPGITVCPIEGRKCPVDNIREENAALQTALKDKNDLLSKVAGTIAERDNEIMNLRSELVQQRRYNENRPVVTEVPMEIADKFVQLQIRIRDSDVEIEDLVRERELMNSRAQSQHDRIRQANLELTALQEKCESLQKALTYRNGEHARILELEQHQERDRADLMSKFEDLVYWDRIKDQYGGYNFGRRVDDLETVCGAITTHQSSLSVAVTKLKEEQQRHQYFDDNIRLASKNFKEIWVRLNALENNPLLTTYAPGPQTFTTSGSITDAATGTTHPNENVQQPKKPAEPDEKTRHEQAVASTGGLSFEGILKEFVPDNWQDIEGHQFRINGAIGIPCLNCQKRMAKLNPPNSSGGGAITSPCLTCKYNAQQVDHGLH